MTGTILTYLKEYGRIPLSQAPLNDVDSLVLCQLAYLKFDGLVPDVNENRPAVSLERVAQAPERERLFSDARYEKVNRELFESMARSRRFGSLRLNYAVNFIEKERETQFSAVTFFLEDGTVYVAFRGTDETIVGWKEDFYMALQSPVPAQQRSVRYLNLAAPRFLKKGTERFLVGGHSKGGNLAVYSAMNCHAQVQERITKIYSMDGPGFRAQVLRECGYDRICDRVVKILPHASLIGMLFEEENRYRVVESNGVGLLQHDPYSWIVRGDHFVEARDLYEGRKFVDRAINEWLRALPPGELKALIDMVFQVLEASEAEDFVGIGADRKKSFLAMAGALRDIAPQDVRLAKEALKELFEIAGNRAMEEITDKFRERSGGNIAERGEDSSSKT